MKEGLKFDFFLFVTSILYNILHKTFWLKVKICGFNYTYLMVCLLILSRGVSHMTGWWCQVLGLSQVQLVTSQHTRTPILQFSMPLSQADYQPPSITQHLALRSMLAKIGSAEFWPHYCSTQSKKEYTKE